MHHLRGEKNVLIKIHVTANLTHFICSKKIQHKYTHTLHEVPFNGIEVWKLHPVNTKSQRQQKRYPEPELQVSVSKSQTARLCSKTYQALPQATNSSNAQVKSTGRPLGNPLKPFLDFCTLSQMLGLSRTCFNIFCRAHRRSSHSLHGV